MGIFMHKYYLTNYEDNMQSEESKKSDAYFEDGYYTDKYNEPWVSLTKRTFMHATGTSPEGEFHLVGIEDFVDENGADAGTWYVWHQEITGQWEPFWGLSRTKNPAVGEELPTTTQINYETNTYILPSTQETTLTVTSVINDIERVNYNKHDYILDLGGAATVQYNGLSDSNIPSGLKSLLIRANSGGPFSLKVTNTQSTREYEFNNIYGYVEEGGGFSFDDVNYQEYGYGIMIYNGETGIIRIGDNEF